jgi:hypothetical protein
VIPVVAFSDAHELIRMRNVSPSFSKLLMVEAQLISRTTAS